MGPSKENLRERAREGASSASNRARGGLLVAVPTSDAPASSDQTASDDTIPETGLQVPTPEPEGRSETPGPTIGPGLDDSVGTAQETRAQPVAEVMVKFTLELPPTLVRRLLEFRLARLRTTGRDEPLERLIDTALGRLSLDPEAAVALADRLPDDLAGEQPTTVGTRIRASVRDHLRELRLLVRLASPHLTMRQVYAAAVWDELSRSAAAPEV
jgi:hypothetical protein